MPSSNDLAPAIEQLMRMSDDEALIVRLASGDRAGVLGRLPADLMADLVPGCPLLALSDDAPPVAVSWRQLYPPAPGSLYSALEFLRALDARDLTDLDSYREFIARREHCEGIDLGPMLEA